MRTASLTVVTGAAGGACGQATTITSSRNWTIGRSDEADIFIDDSRVSRQHLVVEPGPGAWLVRDVSTNGSWHAGARIGRDGLAVPIAGELRVNLGNPAGPEVIITSENPAGAPAAGYGQPAPPPWAGYAPAQSPPSWPPPPDAPPPPNWSGPPNASGPSSASVPSSWSGPSNASRPPTKIARRTSRRRRRIVITLVVLLLLLVVGDRIAARLAATQAVSRVVQQSQGLATNPSVSFGGFPFLTQVAFGKYTDIKVGMDDLVVSGSPRIEHITGHLKGAHIPLSKAINDDVETIPVDQVTATLEMRFSDLNAFLKDQPGHLVLAASGDQLKITGSVDVLGETVKVSGTGRVAVDADGLMVSASQLSIDDGDTIDLPGGLGLGSDDSLFPPVPVPLPGLPFKLRLTSVQVRSDGLSASAAADDVVLDAK